jgi:AbrB family looped-hinge helix DNA binding protein
MTQRVGPKGLVVIPKAIRDELGILPGDEVVVMREGRAVRIVAAAALEDLRGAYAGSPILADLEKERRKDRERERRKYPG